MRMVVLSVSCSGRARTTKLKEYAASCKVSMGKVLRGDMQRYRSMDMISETP